MYNMPGRVNDLRSARRNTGTQLDSNHYRGGSSLGSSHLKRHIHINLAPVYTGLYEYVFIKNDIVFNENATIVLHLHIVFVSFSHRFRIVFISFSPVFTKTMKTIDNCKKPAEIYCLRLKEICVCCCIVLKRFRFQ